MHIEEGCFHLASWYSDEKMEVEYMTTDSSDETSQDNIHDRTYERAKRGHSEGEKITELLNHMPARPSTYGESDADISYQDVLSKEGDEEEDISQAIYPAMIVVDPISLTQVLLTRKQRQMNHFLTIKVSIAKIL